MRKYPKFESDHLFSRTLNKRVLSSLDPDSLRDNYSHYFKGFITIFWALGTYTSLYYVQNSWVLIFLCIISGIGHTAVGFNLFHDAVHGSLSKHKIINRTVAFFTCSILGVSQYLWRFKHNYLHHQFPNLDEYDDDLETRDALRLSPYQKSRWRYRFQHIYCPFVYGMTSFEWIFIKDFKQYFTLKMSEKQAIPRLSKWDHFEFWATKVIYYSFYVALPLYFFSLPQFIIGMIVFHFSFSLAMASIFQLAHVMPELSFPKLEEGENVLKDDRAALQLRTTVNFATNSWFLNWYTGGLNHQVEHHLFPRISHIHYPEISKIVKEVAKEFNLPYYEIETYSQALKSHLIQLKKLGKSPASI